MPGGVPLGRRNLFADRRRLAASVVAVGLAVMLMLLLQGFQTGVRVRSTLLEDRLGADLYVAQPGTNDLQGDVSVVPSSDVNVARADPGVAWAVPLRALYVMLDLQGHKQPVYLLGSVPGGRGGPWRISQGRRATTDDEIVISPVLAHRYGFHLGGTLPLMGRTFRIVGYAGDAIGFMVTFVYVTHAATDSLLAAPDTTSVVLIGTRPGQAAAVQSRLTSEGLNVITRSEVATADRALLTGIFGSFLGLMVIVAFAAGVAIVSETVYTSVVERRREYGIIKAIGASRRHLVEVAVGQTLAVAALGLATGLVLFVIGRELIIWYRPQFAVIATGSSVVAAAVAALAMALLAALVPARRLAALDPASAYRGA
jgi:putative ABC transport system permease protein